MGVSGWIQKGWEGGGEEELLFKYMVFLYDNYKSWMSGITFSSYNALGVAP